MIQIWLIWIWDPLHQIAWMIKQPERPVWSACPVSWTACPRWKPVAVGRLALETHPASPQAALTHSPAHRRAPDPGPSTTSCEANLALMWIYIASGGRRAFTQHQLHLQPKAIRTSFGQVGGKPSRTWGTRGGQLLYCTWDCKYVM